MNNFSMVVLTNQSSTISVSILSKVAESRGDSIDLPHLPLLPIKTTYDTCPYSFYTLSAATQWILMVFLPIVWVLTVIYATVIPKSRVGILSIKKSYQDMVSGRQSRLSFLDIMRVVAILWVMMNHTGSEGRIDILERLPSAVAFKTAVHEHPIFGALLGNSALGVEVFLVLSGLLAARSWQKNHHLPFFSHYSKYVYRRVSRLVPSVFIFIMIAAGPLIKYLLPRFESTMISACGVKGLLAHILFVGNWQEIPTCLGYLWYIGLDMQLHLMAPFFMWALNKNSRVAIGIVAFTVFGSSIIRAIYCITYDICNKSDVDIPFISYPDSDPIAIRSVYLGLWEMYARPYTKCGPFLIGLTFGWISASWEKSAARISKKVACMMFFCGGIMAILTIYAILPEYWWPDMSSNIYNVTYTATFRSVFATSLICMIAALTQTTEPVYVPVFWSVLARLTFAAYLLHMPVVYIFNYLDYLQKAESAIALLVVLPAVAAVSFTVAIPFYLLIESPIGRISVIYETYHNTPSSSSIETRTSDVNHNVPLLNSKLEE